MDIIFDIDGTLLDISHRLHLIKKNPPNWKEFKRPSRKKWDTPRLPIINIAVALQKAGHRIILCSGRTTSERNDTVSSLSRFFDPMPPLYMRREGDYRPDTEVKAMILEMLREIRFNPVMAFDDRPAVVRMWKENGLIVADVGNGVEF